jgi:hypothetical protein
MKKKSTVNPNPKDHEITSHDISANVPVKQNYTTVKHLANPGDVVAIMASLKRYYEATERKVILCQQVGVPGHYYPGAVHPTTNEHGVNVTFNDAMFEMMKPLVESQPYIAAMEKFSGQPIILDFDVIRGKTFCNMPKMAIQSWIMFAFPDLACDLSKPWIHLDDKCPAHISKQVKGKVIVNFTQRYRNAVLNYFYLKHYAPDLIFAGTEQEHFMFCNQNQLTIPHLKVNNFLEYAYAIKEAKFLVGNQSLGWNLTAAMGTPSSLELCEHAPNCLPFYHPQQFGYYHQVANEYYFRRLYNETK